jgi:hypothetical protein
LRERALERLQIFSLEAWFKGQRPALPAPIAITIPKDSTGVRMTLRLRYRA